jgi:hypothetical protein
MTKETEKKIRRHMNILLFLPRRSRARLQAR